MSKKFRDKLLKSSGYSNKKFECDYGMKLLKAMGWKEDEGLGAKGSGRTECVQIHRRDDQLGLGAAENAKAFAWNDTWWEDQYNKTMTNLQVNLSASESEKNTSDTEEEPEHDERCLTSTKGRKNKLNFVKKIDQPYETSDSESEDENDYQQIIAQSKKIKKVIKVKKDENKQDTKKPAKSKK